MNNAQLTRKVMTGELSVCKANIGSTFDMFPALAQCKMYHVLRRSISWSAEVIGWFMVSNHCDGSDYFICAGGRYEIYGLRGQDKISTAFAVFPTLQEALAAYGAYDILHDADAFSFFRLEEQPEHSGLVAREVLRLANRNSDTDSLLGPILYLEDGLQGLPPVYEPNMQWRFNHEGQLLEKIPVLENMPVSVGCDEQNGFSMDDEYPLM